MCVRFIWICFSFHLLSPIAWNFVKTLRSSLQEDKTLQNCEKSCSHDSKCVAFKLRLQPDFLSKHLYNISNVHLNRSYDWFLLSSAYVKLDSSLNKTILSFPNITGYKLTDKNDESDLNIFKPKPNRTIRTPSVQFLIVDPISLQYFLFHNISVAAVLTPWRSGFSFGVPKVQSRMNLQCLPSIHS